jgi:hypothetical protein
LLCRPPAAGPAPCPAAGQVPPAGAPGGRRCRPRRAASCRPPPPPPRRLPCHQHRPAVAERPATHRPAGPAPARPPVATPAGWSPRPAGCPGRYRGSAAPPAWRAARRSTRGRTPRSRSRSGHRTPPRPPRWPTATQTSAAPPAGRAGRPVPQAGPATPRLHRPLPVRPARPPASPPSPLSRLDVPGTLQYHQSAQSPDNAEWWLIHESAGALRRRPSRRRRCRSPLNQRFPGTITNRCSKDRGGLHAPRRIPFWRAGCGV